MRAVALRCRLLSPSVRARPAGGRRDGVGQGLRDLGRARGFRIRRARRRRRELMWWKSWTSGVAALAAARRADNSTSAPDAATKPADAAAAHAIDAVRAVGDVSVQAIRRRRTDAVVEMKVLTNYCVAAFRDEPRVLPINSSS